MPPSELHGEVALMLCESLLHVLVEEGVLGREKALEAVATVAELVREKDPRDRPGQGEASPSQLMERIAATFAVKD